MGWDVEWGQGTERDVERGQVFEWSGMWSGGRVLSGVGCGVGVGY